MCPLPSHLLCPSAPPTSSPLSSAPPPPPTHEHPALKAPATWPIFPFTAEHVTKTGCCNGKLNGALIPRSIFP